MLNVSFGSDICLLDRHSYFRLSYGVRPSFGQFMMGATAAQDAVTTGTPSTLTLHGVALYNIHPVKCEVGDALSPTIGRIYLADERVLWPFSYGTQNYNTYKLDRTLTREIDGDEIDFDLDNRAVLWDGTVTYEIDNWTREDGSTYKSLQNNNLNHAVDEATWWEKGEAPGCTFIEIFKDLFETTLGYTSANYTLQLQAIGGDVPTRKPRNIKGKNIPVPEILRQVLKQANCFLAVDLLTNPPHYQVIPIGDIDTYQSAITYRIGEIATAAGVQYRSLQNVNLNKSPASEASWWTALITHKSREVLINVKTSRGSAAKMLVSKPYFDDDGFYETQGAIGGIGGTGDYFTPAPYEAFYEGTTLKNSQFLTDMGDELAKEYSLSFQNTWYELGYAGALPLSLGRGAQEITWELTDQKGFTTCIRSFRPREEAFSKKHTLYAYDQFWAGGGGFGNISWYVITQTLKYADPTDEENPQGFAIYRGRTWGDAIIEWALNQEVIEGDERLNLGFVYTAKLDHTTDAGNMPSEGESNAWWTLAKDTILEGLTREGDSHFTPVLSDLRNYIPWFAIGDVVPVISRGSGGTALAWATGVTLVEGDKRVAWGATYEAKLDHTTAEGNKPTEDESNAWWKLLAVDDMTHKYILQTLTPCGSEQYCSLRWNEEKGRAMAVYR